MNYPKAIGPYSAFYRTKELLFVSGQLGLEPATMEFAGADAAAQARQSLKNLGEILKQNGLCYKSVVKTTIFLANIEDFAAVNEVYASFFSEPFPARSAVAVKALPKGGLVEIEAIASFKE